ncbi:MAG: dihydroneopterin aldolase [Bacteroidetes bacterium]|nr:dihydroneopterin aldolase [Bacteroidota bacterium]
MKTLSTVKIENLRLRSYIGFIDWEKEKLQDVVISFSFKYDTSLASETDDVQYAVDYKKLTKKIISMVDNQSFHLIEALAEKIYQFIFSYSSAIQNIEVKVEKPHALRFADNVLVSISSEDRYNSAIIALGSNINPEENFEKALSELQKIGIITQRSEFIFTKALKFEDQPDFLNGAIFLQTKKTLSELKLLLKQIEAVLGRVRTENKNAPRTIDLDVTTYNGFLIDQEISDFPFLEKFVNKFMNYS